MVTAPSTVARPLSGATTRPRRARGGERSRAAVHLLTIAGLLIAAMLWIGPGLFTIDEAAYRLQAETLSAGSWELEYPTDEVVDQNLFAPLALSQTFENGWTPYSEHPLYPALVRESLRLSPTNGPVLLSILGTLIAAVGVGAIRRWIDGGSPIPAYWLTAILSPLAIHSQIVWAHTLTVGCLAVALAAVLFATTSREAWWPRVGIAATAAACAVLLRTEAPIAVMAIAVCPPFVPGVDWRRRVLVGGAVAGAGGVAAIVDRLWFASMGSATSVPAPPRISEGWIDGRIDGLVNVLLGVGSGGPITMLWLLVPFLLLLASVKAQAASVDAVLVRMLASSAVVAAGVAATAVEALPGWLPAVPLGGVILFGAWQIAAARPVVLCLATTFALLTIVMPPDAGGRGWGARYALATLPALAALAVVVLDRLKGHDLGRIVVVAGLVATLLVQVTGLRELHQSHEASSLIESELEVALSGFGQDTLIVAPDIRIGRAARSVAVQVPLMSLSRPGHLPAALRVARDGDIERVALIELVNHAFVEIPEGWVVVEDSDDGLLRTREIHIAG